MSKTFIMLQLLSSFLLVDKRQDMRNLTSIIVSTTCFAKIKCLCFMRVKRFSLMFSHYHLSVS
ncbi:hypothetical protein GLYMA_02G088550v4 [Glycine max]|nr:hypothetical protein GLYMA_02G088550v4 [Glycine max]KAH1059435.1 hypothetical protein GYH30_003450 [Glycine max]